MMSLILFSAFLSLAYGRTSDDLAIVKREKLREPGNYLRVTECVQIELSRRLLSDLTYVENVEVLFVGPNRGITLLMSEFKGRTAVSASATCNTFVELYEPAFLLGKANEEGSYTFSVPVKTCGTTFYQAVDEVKCELSRIAKYKACDTWYGPPDHNMPWFKYRGRGKKDNSDIVGEPATLGSFDGYNKDGASTTAHSSSMGIWAVKKEDRPTVGRYGPNTKWFRTKFECEEPTGGPDCHPQLDYADGQSSDIGQPADNSPPGLPSPPRVPGIGSKCREGWSPFDCLRGDKIVIYAPDGEIVHVIDDGSTDREPLFKGTAQQQFTDELYFKIFSNDNPFSNIYDNFIPFVDNLSKSSIYLSDPFTTDCHILNQGYYWRLEGHNGHHFGVFEIYSSIKYEGPYGWELLLSDGDVDTSQNSNSGGEGRMYIENGAGNIDIWSNNLEIIRGTNFYRNNKGEIVGGDADGEQIGEWLNSAGGYVHSFATGPIQPGAPPPDPDYDEIHIDPTDFPFRDFGK